MTTTTPKRSTPKKSTGKGAAGSQRAGRTSRASASAQERFERRLSAKRRRSWKLAAVLALLGALAAGIWWVLWRSDWLLVEQVVVTGTEPRWHGQILDAAAIPLSQPMVEVETGPAEQAVREVPIVRDVAVVHSWPRTVTVKVEPRVPVLGIRQSSGHVMLVDADGVSIETVSRLPEAVPEVVARGAAGSTAAAYRAAWGVVDALPAAITDDVTTVTVSSAELVTLTLGEQTLVWGGPEDAELKAEVAQALLAAGALRVDVSAPHTPVTEGSILPPEDESADD